MRARAEQFGAIVAIDAPAALVSIDRVLARRLGIDGAALWSQPDPGLAVPVLSAPTEVHLAVTAHCGAGCAGCYMDARPEGDHPSTAELLARIDALADLGIFALAFGGGEALLRDDLHVLAAHARARGLAPTMTTSGLGLTAAQARTLRDFAQINVSHDGTADVYRSVRGWDGAARAERAIALLRAEGIAVGVNTVLTRHSLPALPATAARVASLGACELQLLRYKPAGRGTNGYLERCLDQAQIAAFPATLRVLSARHSPALALRVDCSLLPFLAGDDSIAPEELSRWGVMGCEAGRSLLAVKAAGTVAPCSFWSGAATPLAARAADSWDADPALTAFRAYAAAPPEPCASCRYRSTCRGGCRVVAGALGATPLAPDPECPRVRAHAAAHG